MYYTVLKCYQLYIPLIGAKKQHSFFGSEILIKQKTAIWHPADTYSLCRNVWVTAQWYSTGLWTV